MGRTLTDYACFVARRIFQEWDTNLQYLLDFGATVFSAMVFLITHICALVVVVLLLLLPFTVLIMCVLLFYLLGPFACAVISSWRIAKLNHHGNNRDADMMVALNIFYSLIIFQGTMCLVLLSPMKLYKENVARRLHSLEELSEKWGEKAMRRYISDISEKCRKDSLSIEGRDLVKYAAELLDSESLEDYLYGARLLSAFVKKGEDVRWLLLPSRHRIQRLIDSLMISSSSRSSLDEACVPLESRSHRSRCLAMIGSLDDKREIRELAATIVEHVAAHIDDLSKYPGAMRCISSLLQHREETTQTYRNRMIYQERMVVGEHRHRHKKEGGAINELVQQGLTILERLASNSDDNSRIICGVPGLLPKITAPIYSATLIQDVKTQAWADIVARCLKVLYQLIRAPGRPSRRLRRQIFSNHQALSNLKSILLELDIELQLVVVTMEILTELALDLSINLTDEIKKVLITEQLQLFLLSDGIGAAMAGSGRTLVSLSTNSESNSALIMTTQDGIIGRLTEILDEKNNIITQRTIIAAEIMANLCAHCNVDNNMNEILPKVLGKIMSIKTKSQQRKISAGENNRALGDEEKQGNFVSTKYTEERHNISTQGDDTEVLEISDQEREQEAFLSLAQVICDKLNSTDLDGTIQLAVQNENNAGSEERRREIFVEKLKTIIDDNCHPTADSLRIVKLCGQIAKSVMRCEQYVEIFRDKGFKSSLSKASKTMSELESCMLFVGTDFGPKKTVRPLFSEIEKSFGQI